jgi:hypothetical protein
VTCGDSFENCFAFDLPNCIAPREPFALDIMNQKSPPMMRNGITIPEERNEPGFLGDFVVEFLGVRRVDGLSSCAPRGLE